MRKHKTCIFVQNAIFVTVTEKQERNTNGFYIFYPTPALHIYGSSSQFKTDTES